MGLPISFFGETSGQLAPELSDRDKAMREIFVRQYLLDYSAIDACVRMGFQKVFAETWSKKFMEEPFTLNLIAEFEKSDFKDPEVKKELTAIVISRLRYEAYHGNSGSRVAALSKLASILQLDTPEKAKSENQARGGVMKVPGTARLEDWEEQAIQRQEELLKDSAI